MRSNHAAGTISKASSRGYNLIQGNNLTVTQVHPKTEVVRESHNVGEAMEDLRRLAEERLGKTDLDSGLDYGTIAISNTVNPTEPTHGSSPFQAQTASTILHLGGRKTSNLMSSDSKQRMEADSARMVQEAMKQPASNPMSPSH